MDDLFLETAGDSWLRFSPPFRSEGKRAKSIEALMPLNRKGPESSCASQVRKLARKSAIFREEDQQRMLDACESNDEYVIVYLMMKYGVHPIDCVYRDKMKYDGTMLRWPRCKTGLLREFLIAPSFKPKLEEWLAHGRRYSIDGIGDKVRTIAKRAGLKGVTPMSLRHTAALMLLHKWRGHADAVQLAAEQLGCTEEVLRRNYVALKDWIQIREDEERCSSSTKGTRKKSYGLISSEALKLSRGGRR